MASLPKSAADADAPQILFLAPDDIHVGERIGMFWPDKAAALGKLIASVGQNDPIKVRRNGNRAKQPWALVAGLHRLEGVKIEGLAHVEAIEVVGTEEQLLEIQASENIHRRSLPPIERACFVHAIAQAAERRMSDQHGELSQQEIAIRARWAAEKPRIVGPKSVEQRAELEADHTRVNLSRVYGWRDNVAASLDLSLAAVKRDLALYRGLVEPFPHLFQDLARHPVVGENASALREIVAVKDETERGRLISFIIQHPGVTVAEAMKAGAGKSPPPPDQKRFNTFTKTFRTMPLSEKKGALAHLMADMPAGYLLLGTNSEGVDSLGPVRSALDSAMSVLVRLIDGGDPVDDEMLADAAAAAQTAFHLVGGGK